MGPVALHLRKWIWHSLPWRSLQYLFVIGGPARESAVPSAGQLRN